MALKKEFDVNSLLPKKQQSQTIKNIKRGYFAFKCFIRLSVVIGGTMYYTHLVYQKEHQDIAMSQTINQDYDLLTQAGKNLGNMIAEPFLALLGKAEGSSYKFYLDNKGFATGYGFNPTQNDANYNKAILKYADVDPRTIDTIVNISSKYKNTQLKAVPEELQNVSFSKKQIQKMAIFARKSYEQDFLIVFKEKMDAKHFSEQREKVLINRYQVLTDEQRAVLIHMTYKVGQPGLEHYNTFFSDFIKYLENPTTENQEKVANDFVYHYKQNGKVLVDTRVDNIHHDLFMKTNHNEQLALTTENSAYLKHPEKVIVDNNQNITQSVNNKIKLTEKQKESQQFAQANKELQDELKEKLTFNHFYSVLKQAVAEHKKYKLEHPNDDSNVYYSNDDSDDNGTMTTTYTQTDNSDSSNNNSQDEDDSDNEQVTYQVTQIIRMTR